MPRPAGGSEPEQKQQGAPGEEGEGAVTAGRAAILSTAPVPTGGGRAAHALPL